MSLQETKQLLEDLLQGYSGFWAVAGGWAIDFFLNEKTREHKDVEIAVWRDEQGSLQRFLRDWSCDYYKQGEPLPWPQGQVLQLPEHEIRCYRGGIELEILLNERKDGTWIYRRDPRITYPVESFSLIGVSGIRVLAPEIVLLYKARMPSETDTRDLKVALENMDANSRQWLAASLATLDSGHAWLKYLNI